jgi:hypothetical protein
MQALERAIPFRVTDGMGKIEFVPKVGQAILSSFSVNPR